MRTGRFSLPLTHGLDDDAIDLLRYVGSRVAITRAEHNLVGGYLEITGVCEDFDEQYMTACAPEYAVRISYVDTPVGKVWLVTFKRKP